MKLKVLSHYNGDKETRFGDCIMVYNTTQLIVYDCGHVKHAESVEAFLQSHRVIGEIHIVISHNDADHTDGITELLEWLSSKTYDVTVYTSLYLKHAEAVERHLNDGRRNKKSICVHILELFDHIAEIVQTAEEYKFSVKDAIKGSTFASVEIVGPREDEFVEVVAKAINEDGKGTINGETVMNAASVQVKATLDNQKKVLLCGDATPIYIHDKDSYDVIQFPHHGQFKDGTDILEEMENPYRKDFIISDNTGSGQTSGGSADLVDYMRKEKYKVAYNSQNGEVSLPASTGYSGTSNAGGVRLGVFYT